MFIDAHLLDGVAYGSAFGTEFRTNITQLKSGEESRIITRDFPLGSYMILLERLKPTDHAKIFGAFQVCHGRGHTFRLRDRVDYQLNATEFGVGSGVEEEYQLVRRYEFGPAVFEVPVTLPNIATLAITEDGQDVAATVNPTTGVVTLTAPPGAVLRATGTFDKLVRFDDDELSFTLETRMGGTLPLLTANVPLREVRS